MEPRRKRHLRRTATAAGIAVAVLAIGYRWIPFPFDPPHPPRTQEPPDFRGRILHRWDFESGEAGIWDKYKLAAADSFRAVADPAGGPGRVARFLLRRDDPDVADGKRAELHQKRAGTIGSGETYWYGFRTLLPADWADDHQYEIVAQWKGNRDDEREAAEPSKSPALALRVRRGRVYWTNRWDARRITPDNDAPSEKLWQGEFARGVWTSWAVRARWSYRDDGLLEIWRDGTKIVEKRGPNTYNDLNDMYFKIGIYKAPWTDFVVFPSRVDRRVVYHDDVWIGREG